MITDRKRKNGKVEYFFFSIYNTHRESESERENKKEKKEIRASLSHP